MKLQIKIDNETFDVEVGDLQARPILATVDGETFEVWPETADPTPVETAPVITVAKGNPAAGQPAAAQPASNGSKSNAVLAPIPGVILSIAVKEGDTVAFGQELCVLEAMKMKNAIRAARAGKISAVCITTGEHVKHSQTLFEYAN